MQQPQKQKKKNVLTFERPHIGRDLQQNTFASPANT